MKNNLFQIIGSLIILFFGILIGWKLPRAAPPATSKAANHLAPTKSNPSSTAQPLKREPNQTRRQNEKQLAAESQQKAIKLANEWALKAHSLGNEEAHEQALDDIFEALQSDDPTQNYAALLAFTRLHDLEFDKDFFRSAILPHLDSSEERILQQAWLALSVSGHHPEDLERL